jgi:transcription antitermination factor NusG
MVRDPLLWYALYVRPRYEKTVTALLEGKGYEPFLPLYQAHRHWSDRIKRIDLPLFPGYVFCRLNVNDRLPVLSTPGVVQIVGVGRRPVPVDDAEIQAIQTVTNSEVASQPWPFLNAGDRVRIGFGPLRGLEGFLLEFRGQYRIVISVNLLQRSVAVQLDRSWVTPLAQGLSRRTVVPERAPYPKPVTA